MSKNKEKLLIIDGNALIHRSFHALPPTMTTKSGQMTNAVFGFCTVLFKALREFKPNYLVLTLDKKAPTFRHEKFSEYKATRTKAPDELYSQIPLVKKVAESFNIPIFEMAGFEADDLIGTISQLAPAKLEKIIVTGDMDTLQLVDDKKNIQVYTMSKGISDSIIYNEKKVKEKFQLTVDQIIDYKALRGDPSDNIPGVRGIGEKTATDLLQNFQTLDGVYKNIDSDKIKDRIKGLLQDHKEEAYLSQMLATIKCDVPVDFSLDNSKVAEFDQEKAVELFHELEFKSLIPKIKNILDDEVDQEEKALDKFARNKKEFKYTLVDDEKNFEKFFQEFKKQKQFTFDTETSSFDPILANLLGISFSWQEGIAYYLKIEINADNSNLFNYQEKSQQGHPWLDKLKPYFENPEIKKFAHNIKYDLRIMKNNGIKVQGELFDTMIASYLLNPGTRQHNLDAVTFAEFGFEKISKKDLLGTGKDKLPFAEADIEKLSLYSCEDADFTNRLVEKLTPMLKEKKQDKLFREIEMPLVEVLVEMEENGIKINESFLQKMSKEVSSEIATIEKKIYKLSGAEFNINSTKQLKEILFEKLEIPTTGIKKTKTGFSTAFDELEKLKDQHEIIPLIQRHRELRKLITTYIDALPELINSKTSRVHSSFNQTVTSTGRLSSTEPNLQNIPVKTDLGKKIRKAFIAEKGNKLVAIDYSQIELRLAAHLSGDKEMIKAFTDGIDIHTRTASLVNKVEIDEVTPKMRRDAKSVNFGILYGQGPHGLAQNTGMTFMEAKNFIDDYLAVFPSVSKYIESKIEEAHEKEYTETMFGRRRYLPEINSSVVMIKKAAERMAINAPIQGTAADMIKIAMIKVYEAIKNNPDIKVLLQVHDELIFEVKEKQAKMLAEKIKKIMEDVVKLKVPIIADIKMGDNWGELKSI